MKFSIVLETFRIDSSDRSDLSDKLLIFHFPAVGFRILRGFR